MKFLHGILTFPQRNKVINLGKDYMSFIPDWFKYFDKDEVSCCKHSWEYRITLSLDKTEQESAYLVVGCEKECSLCSKVEDITKRSNEDDKLNANIRIACYMSLGNILADNPTNPPICEFTNYDCRKSWIKKHGNI